MVKYVYLTCKTCGRAFRSPTVKTFCECRRCRYFFRMEVKP